MKELLTFCLPPLLALCGMRINRWLFGDKWHSTMQLGCRFALGLATSLLMFSQLVLLTTVLGVPAAGVIAWTGFLGGIVEVVLRCRQVSWRPPWQTLPRHWWKRSATLVSLAALIPLAVLLTGLALLSVLDGILEFDGIAFWVFKAKVMYLEQGAGFRAVHQEPTLAYAHWDYPLLVPSLYALNHGLTGGVYDFAYKVWPFWMLVALVSATLSLGRFWHGRGLLAVIAATVVAFLPGVLFYVRMEGGTMPMVFFAGLTTLVAMSRLQIATNGCHLGSVTLLLTGCACTKFEGMVLAGALALTLLPQVVRKRWWREPAFRRGAAVAGVTLLPYFLFRFTQPHLHPESEWLAEGLARWREILSRFPVVWLLSLAHRFCLNDSLSFEFTSAGNLKLTSIHPSPITLVDEELDVLPFLLLLLTVATWWHRPKARALLASLGIAMISTSGVIALAITCLPRMQSDWETVIEFTRLMVGRYYLPLFVAWLFAVITPWLCEPTSAADSELTPECNSTTAPASAPLASA